MNTEFFYAWFNYKTNDYEYRDTPEDFTDYIPQDRVAQGLYKCHLALGETPINAARKTLSAYVGKPG